ncbi:hypothetical protein DRQ09_00770 [candidate division KSB1 bacterium]|nr:MAG: hypothetical protein DRQ09_00770 [candidate division KSB1 bacterium]
MKDREPLIKEKVDKRLFGFFFIILGSICAGTLGVFVKFGYKYGATPITLLFIRYITGTAFFWIVTLLLRYKIERIGKKDLLILFSGSIFLFISSMCYFYALTYITIPLAITIVYLYPALVTLLAFALFKEKLGKIKTVALFLSFAGCIILTKLFNSSGIILNPTGIILSLVCAFSVAMYTIIIQKTLNKYRIFDTAVYFTTFSGVMISIFILPRYQILISLNVKVWLVGIFMAFFTIFLTRILFFLGIKYVGASRMSIIASSELIFASILAFIFLGESLDIVQGIGALLIFIGAILVNFDHPGKL